MARQAMKSGAKRPSKGEQQRDRILNHAIKLASTEGLEALTIGRLATALDMSKSGLFAHLGSKQKLQLATIEKAHEMFDQAVLQPVEESAAGIARLWTLCDLWLMHLQDGVFPSGYFFTGAFFECGPKVLPACR